MSLPASLIPQLENVINHGSSARRTEALKRITDLFVSGASLFNEDHVRLFDDVFSRMIGGIETKARGELSHRLAPIGNAPPQTVRRLAKDHEISVARAVLEQSRRLEQSDLIEIAETKGQAHLLAISGQAGITEPVTDILVRRGDREVLRSLAANSDARLSDGSFFMLVEKAAEDRILAERVGLRSDIPPRLFRDLLLQTTQIVQHRPFASARPEMRSEIRRVVPDVGHEAVPVPRDYTAAEARIRQLSGDGRLDEATVVELAKNERYEETVAAIAALCAVPIEVVDRLMAASRADPILILCKSVGWSWQTARAIVTVRPGGAGISTQALDAACVQFDRLSPTTAQRVMRFWQVQSWQQQTTAEE